MRLGEHRLPPEKAASCNGRCAIGYADIQVSAIRFYSGRSTGPQSSVSRAILLFDNIFVQLVRPCGAGRGAPMESLDLDVPIEVDVYELLWRSRVRTYLPESIVFKFGRLDSWFFTACEKGGQPRIKRKRDYTVRRGDVVENIVSSFCAHAVGDHDIVATWIAGQQGENCKMMHITASTLLRFLEHIKGSETGHGVLQRWSVPFGGHSTMLRTDWTPHHFGLEMCTNWHSVRASPLTRRPHAHRCAHHASDAHLMSPHAHISAAFARAGQRHAPAARRALGDF